MTPDREGIRILHVVGRMDRGGTETWLMRILRAMDRDRFHMDFLVHTTDECAYNREIRELGCRLIPCTQCWPWDYERAIRTAMRENGPYDIVHSQLYLFSGLILRAAAKTGVPVRIAHMHPLSDVDNDRPGRGITRWLCLSWLSRYSTCVLAPSRTTLDAFAAVCDCSRQYKSVMANCIELEPYRIAVDRAAVRRELGLPPDLPVAVYVARFVPHKNHALLFKIADAINKTSIQVHFVLAGSHGPMMEELRAMAAARDDVSMIVGLPDVSRLLMASDVFVFPSIEEGFGVVALEAAAAGLPVVATSLPTIREAVPPSYHELMFEPNDYRTAAKHVLSVLANAGLRERLATDGREWAARFSVDRSVEELISVYERCLAASRGADCSGPRSDPASNRSKEIHRTWVR